MLTVYHILYVDTFRNKRQMVKFHMQVADMVNEHNLFYNIDYFED